MAIFWARSPKTGGPSCASSTAAGAFPTPMVPEEIGTIIIVESGCREAVINLGSQGTPRLG